LSSKSPLQSWLKPQKILQTKIQNSIIDAINESEDSSLEPSKATNQESEQHQLINVSEDPSKVEGEGYTCCFGVNIKDP